MSIERDLKLLGKKESLFTHRVIWILKMKGIHYEFIEEDLSNKSSLLLKLNPIYKKVPVIVPGEKVLSESLVILDYVDETWPENSILPKDPPQRAYARFWAKFVDEKFYQAATTTFFSSGEDRAKGTDVIAEAIQFIDKEINGKKFFGAETIGYLDIVVGWIAYWFQFVEEVGEFKVMDSEKYPSMDSWMKNFLDVPVIKRTFHLMMHYTQSSKGSRTSWPYLDKDESKIFYASRPIIAMPSHIVFLLLSLFYFR